MKTPKFLALLLVAGMPLALACKSHEAAEADDRDDTATAATPAEIPGANQANDLNPVEAQTMVDDVTIGHKAGADGTIAAADQGDDFAPGDPVVIAMKVGDAPAGSQVKVIWYGPGETKIGEESKGVNTGATFLVFENTNTASWAKGDYRAEVWIGDEKVNQQTFNIVDKTEAGK
jgi:hypothetical protein